MSYFNKFPNRLYDLNNDGNVSTITDIFRYVDVVEDYIDQFSSYKFIDITDRERPDNLSQRLYGSPDYYWTFFVVNNNLKEGLSSWAMGENQRDEYISYTYDGLGVLSFPHDYDESDSDSIGLNSLEGLPINDSKYKDNVYLVSTAAGASSGAETTAIKIEYWDQEKYQLWVDKTKQYVFNNPSDGFWDVGASASISSDLATNLEVHLPLTTSYITDGVTAQDLEDLDGRTTWSPTWSSIVDARLHDLSTNNYGAGLAYDTSDIPLLGDGTLYFDGVNDYAILEPSQSGVFGVGAYDNLDDDNSPFAWHEDQNFSISFWIRTDMGSGATNDSEAENGVIVGADTGSTNLAIIDGKFTLAALLDNGISGLPATSLATLIQTTTEINDNQWHHCVFVNTGASKTADLYVDGVKEVSATDFDLDQFLFIGISYELYFVAKFLMFGKLGAIDSDSDTSDEDYSTATRLFTRGSLRDFRIYSTNLSGTQVNNLYRYGGSAGILAEFSKLFTDSDLDTSNNNVFFGWNTDTYLNSNLAGYDYHVRYLRDSDDDANWTTWESSVSTLANDYWTDDSDEGTTRLYDLNNSVDKSSKYIQRSSYYWEDASLAPAYYYTNTNYDGDSDEYDEISGYDALVTEGTNLRSTNYISNTEDAIEDNDSRQRIRIVDPAAIDTFVDQFNKLLNNNI